MSHQRKGIDRAASSSDQQSAGGSSGGGSQPASSSAASPAPSSGLSASRGARPTRTLRVGSSVPSVSAVSSPATSSSSFLGSSRDGRRSDGRSSASGRDSSDSGQPQSNVNAALVHRAVKNGDLAQLRTLLSAGGTAALSVRDAYGQTPLHCAAFQQRSVTSSDSAVSDASRIHSLTSARDTAFASPLASPAEIVSSVHSSSTIDILNELLSHGAPLNERDQNGWTPLHCAASSGTLSACFLLLEAGADHAACSNSNSQPLHYFVRVPLSPAASRIVTTAYVSARLAQRSAGGSSAVDPSSDAYSAQVADYAQPLPCERDAATNVLDPESRAAAAGYVEVLRKWEEMGADVECVDNKGETPLHCAAFTGRPHSVAWLLYSGVDPDRSNHAGETPLLLAVQRGCHDSVVLLLNAGADPEASSPRGSCVDFAVTCGHAEILETLTAAVKRRRRIGTGRSSASDQQRHSSEPAQQQQQQLTPLMASPTLGESPPDNSDLANSGATAPLSKQSDHLVSDHRNQPWQVVFNGPFLITPNRRCFRHLRAITARGFASQHHHRRYERGFFYTLHLLEEGAAPQHDPPLRSFSDVVQSVVQSKPVSSVQSVDPLDNVSAVPTPTRSGDFSNVHVGPVFYTSELVSRTQNPDWLSLRRFHNSKRGHQFAGLDQFAIRVWGAKATANNDCLPPNPTDSLTQPPHLYTDGSSLPSLEDASRTGLDLLHESLVNLCQLGHIGEMSSMTFPANTLLFELMDGHYAQKELIVFMTARRLLSSPKLRKGATTKGTSRLDEKALQTLPSIEAIVAKLEASRAKSAELYSLVGNRLEERFELYRLREKLVLKRQEVAALRVEGQEVSQLLADEEEDLNRTKAFLLPAAKTLLDAEHTLVARTASLKTLVEVVEKESLLVGAVQRSLQARRARLVQELADVFPIQDHLDNKHLSIGGFPLRPFTPENATFGDDDQLATGYGHVAHLIHMLSKWFGFTLRYPVTLLCSRSLISDDVIKYPLYGRKADPARFGTAVRLLNQNIVLLMGDVGCKAAYSHEYTLENLQDLIAFTSRLC